MHGLFADRLVVPGPGGQPHKRGRQPISRALDHEFFGHLRHHIVGDVSHVEGLEHAHAGAADERVVPINPIEFAFEIAELGFGTLHDGDTFGLPREFFESLR